MLYMCSLCPDKGGCRPAGEPTCRSIVFGWSATSPHTCKPLHPPPWPHARARNGSCVKLSATLQQLCFQHHTPGWVRVRYPRSRGRIQANSCSSPAHTVSQQTHPWGALACHQAPACGVHARHAAAAAAREAWSTQQTCERVKTLHTSTLHTPPHQHSTAPLNVQDAAVPYQQVADNWLAKQAPQKPDGTTTKTGADWLQQLVPSSLDNMGKSCNPWWRDPAQVSGRPWVHLHTCSIQTRK